MSKKALSYLDEHLALIFRDIRDEKSFRSSIISEFDSQEQHLENYNDLRDYENNLISAYRLIKERIILMEKKKTASGVVLKHVIKRLKLGE